MKAYELNLLSNGTLEDYLTEETSSLNYEMQDVNWRLLKYNLIDTLASEVKSVIDCRLEKKVKDFTTDYVNWKLNQWLLNIHTGLYDDFESIIQEYESDYIQDLKEEYEYIHMVAVESLRW